MTTEHQKLYNQLLAEGSKRPLSHSEQQQLVNASEQVAVHYKRKGAAQRGPDEQDVHEAQATAKFEKALCDVLESQIIVHDVPLREIYVGLKSPRQVFARQLAVRHEGMRQVAVQLKAEQLELAGVAQ